MLVRSNEAANNLASVFSCSPRFFGGIFSLSSEALAKEDLSELGINIYVTGFRFSWHRPLRRSVHRSVILLSLLAPMHIGGRSTDLLSFRV